MKFVSLIAVVPPKRANEAIELVKENGGGSVIIFKADHFSDKNKFIPVKLLSSKKVSLLMFLLPRKLSLKIIKKLRDFFQTDTKESEAIIFTMPISHIVGIDSDELRKFHNQIRDMV